MQWLIERTSVLQALCRIAVPVVVVWLVASPAKAQKPTAELPRVHVDTTWNEPKSGKRWAAHNSDDLRAALAKSAPGDVIVLDAGATYTGAFTLPAKVNPASKWIYVVSSDLASLPEGTRVAPADVIHMAKIVSPNTASPFTVANGANYWRIAGLELTATSSYPTGCGTPTLHCMTYFVVNSLYDNGKPRADHIYFDRVYAHGSPTQDFQGGIELNWDWAAVVDSYISDIHIKGFDTNATGANSTLGPIKIVNNHLEASTENIIFGGGGGNANPGVPSDIEIRNNYIYKPLAWAQAGVGCCGNQTMVVKNAFEVKCGQRILFDSNTIENVWAGGQLGFAIVLTVRTGQTGDFCVDQDITITNNVLKNVVSGINLQASDDTCGPGGGYPNCLNAGSTDRIYVANNLLTHYDPTAPGGTRNAFLIAQPGANRIAGTTPPTLGQIRGIVAFHNTSIASPGHPCWTGIWIGTPSGVTEPPSGHHTENLWFNDNVLCAQIGSDGARPLSFTMPWPDTKPNDLAARLAGNVMMIPPPMAGLPASNGVFSSLTFNANNELVTPDWTAHTTDGKPAGVDSSALPKPATGNP